MSVIALIKLNLTEDEEEEKTHAHRIERAESEFVNNRLREVDSGVSISYRTEMMIIEMRNKWRKGQKQH